MFPVVTDPAVRVVLHGTRGSLPLSGRDFRDFGGHTICFEVRCGPHVLMFDAGSGIKPAGSALAAQDHRNYHLFFSHCHYDHIVGLPFFAPLYCPDRAVTFWSGHMSGAMTTEAMLRDFMRPPWFPVEIDVWRAAIGFRDFRSGEVLTPCPGVTIRTGMLNHPGGSIGYRIEYGSQVIAIITDTEHQTGVLDPVILSLIEGADLVLYDAAYDEAEMDTWRGFGHSSWQHGIALAKAAHARRIGFIHHALWRTDAELKALARRAQQSFPAAFFGYDGQVLELRPDHRSVG